MIKLQDILYEIKREQKRVIKEGVKTAKSHVLGTMTITAIINSNGLPAAQTKALKEFFKHYNKGVTPMLNENTVKQIDKRISTLSESNFLTEGFRDWIKKVGKGALDFLKAGWDGVKKVWSNFKDIISTVIETVKTGLQKLAAAAWDKVKGLWSTMKAAFDKNADKSKEHLDKHEPSDIATEWDGIKKSVVYLTKYTKGFISGDGWAAEVESGNVTPVGNTVVENVEHLKLKINKSLVEELLNLNLLTEGIHLEDLLNKEKYPMGHKICKYVLAAIGWAFNPINTALKYLVKFLIGGWTKDGKSGILYTINKCAELLGGPKAIAYPILGFLCMELTETALSGLNLASHSKMLGTLQVGVEVIDKLGINIWETFHHLIELVPGLGVAVTVTEWICIAYAVGNFILTVFPEIVKKINPKFALAH